jgi:hypothetical protein
VLEFYGNDIQLCKHGDENNVISVEVEGLLLNDGDMVVHEASLEEANAEEQLRCCCSCSCNSIDEDPSF